MKNSMKDIRKLIKYPEGILSVSLHESGSSNATLFCMSKGSGISDHTSTKEGLVYVIEGKGVFRLEGKDICMLPGILIRMEKNAVHSLKADENTAFLLFLND